MARKKKEGKTAETEERKEELKEKKEEPVKLEAEVKEKAKVEKLNLDSLKSNSKEIENLIVKMANEGMTASKIGTVLRDSHGIPSIKAINKKIGKILAEKGIGKKIPDDMSALVKNAETLKKHIEKNKQDIVAKRGLQLTEAKIAKLASYFKKKGVLPQNWKH